MLFRIVVAIVAVCFVTLPPTQAADERATISATQDLYSLKASGFAPTDGIVTISASRTGSLIVLTGYCAAIMVASAAGGWLPSLFTLNHTRMQTVISFVGGLMLGIAVFHLLPHSVHGSNTIDNSAWWMMVGIVTMFLLIRSFHFHHHGPLEISTALEEPCTGHDHDHDHDHDHKHVAPSAISQPYCHHAHQLSWVGIAIGLSLHTLIDGIALAASVEADSLRQSRLSLFGIGTFLAIMLHKPLDAVSITSLMAGSGWKSQSRFLVNLVFSAMCPIGAAMFVLGIRQFSAVQDMIVCSVIAFSAGVFLCIALSDLLPEMEFHAHNRFRLTVALTGGILLAYGITFLEPGHLH
ncbi:MAG TPA: ZIP family metal transporter [Planctomycetaceae bacterium]|nr:ZIP family metal transporter [Planctomycetaceae bacterium]